MIGHDDDLPPASVDDHGTGRSDDQSLSSNITVLSNSDTRIANAETLRQEQLADESLKGWWGLAKKQKGNFVVQDGLLYHRERILEKYRSIYNTRPKYLLHL